MWITRSSRLLFTNGTTVTVTVQNRHSFLTFALVIG